MLDIRTHWHRFTKGGGISVRERDFKGVGQSAGEQDHAAPGRPDEQDAPPATVRSCLPLVARVLPLKVAVRGGCKGVNDLRLAAKVPGELYFEVLNCWHGPRLCLGTAPPTLLLVDDRLAQLDALTADVHVARPFDEGSDVAVALAAEGAVGVTVGHSFHHGELPWSGLARIDTTASYGLCLHSCAQRAIRQR
jgi:hypothetical protein